MDAHRGEHGPRRALVVEQPAGRPDPPPDPPLAAFAVARAVRAVLAHLDGGEPSAWSATVEIGPDLHPRRSAWARRTALQVLLGRAN